MPEARQGAASRQEERGASGELTGWRVLQSLGESVAVLDRRFRVLWVKEPMLPPGHSATSMVGQYCYRAFFNSDQPCQDRCPVRPIFANGRPRVVERHFIGPDGQERWREARAYPVLDGEGRVAFAARISFDITHRKLVENRDRREHDLLERALGELNRLRLDELPFQPSQGAPLSRRELEVLALLARGLSNPSIAALLGLSPNTVKRHVAHVFDKLEVNDRTQAAVWAARQGLV